MPEANVTVPVGIDPVTVAVSVICPFTSPAVGEAFKAVVVAACPMVTLTAAEMLALLLLSPAYDAVIA
jgi:hypothetical protein